MILTDREIKNSLAAGLFELKPLPKLEAYAPSAVDLTLGSSIRVFKPLDPDTDNTVDPSREGFNIKRLIENRTVKYDIPEEGYILKGGMLILAWTVESIALHEHARVAARVEGKSGLARIGLAVHVTAPTIHAGFKGSAIQLEVINHGPLPIRLKTGMPICQLIFEQTLGMPESTYNGQFLGQAP